jgi:hydrogenase-1 operon protein HyaF
MPSIDQIPIHVLSPDEMLTGQAEAVLTEVAELLERLLQTGEEGSIDLHGLPLSPADKVWLDQQLGRGEVEITLDAGGRSVLTETGFSGVWKVLHRDTEDRVVAELIEVAYVPSIVKPAYSDMQKSFDHLKLKLMQIGH